MEEIVSLLVRQVRFFPLDFIPFSALNSASASDIFRKGFGFREVIPDASAGDLYFVAGMMQLPESENPVTINYVQFTPQRMAIEVVARSSIASSVYEAMAKVLGQFGDSRIDKTSPLLLTEETQCVARLGFSWRALLSEKFKDFLDSELQTRTSSPVAAVRLSSMNLRFFLQYDLQDLRLREYGVALWDKSLVVEPRQSTPLTENLFFTSSPLDSDSHLQLVADLECVLAGRRNSQRTLRRPR